MHETTYIVTVPRERYEATPDYAQDRKLLETLAGVPCRMMHYSELPPEGLPPGMPVLLSGGKAAPGFPFEDVYFHAGFRRLVLEPAGPTLAICRSFQLAAALLGVGVRAMPARPGLHAKDGGWYEEGPTRIRLLRADPLFEGLGPEITVLEHHRNETRQTPPGFLPLAFSTCCLQQAWRHPSLPFYGVQFHPERGQHPDGLRLLRNFFDICTSFEYI